MISACKKFLRSVSDFSEFISAASRIFKSVTFSDNARISASAFSSDASISSRLFSSSATWARRESMAAAWEASAVLFSSFFDTAAAKSASISLAVSVSARRMPAATSFLRSFKWETSFSEMERSFSRRFFSSSNSEISRRVFSALLVTNCFLLKIPSRAASESSSSRSFSA